MSKKSLDKLFDKIQDSLNKGVNSSESTSFPEFLKLETGNAYEVRLIPNFDNPDDTFFHFRYHGWKSFATGNYVQFICPSIYGDPSPINIESWRIQNESDDEEFKEKSKALWRKEGWLANVYVVKDPVNSDNNGEVKVLKMGKQLKSKITEAMEDDDLGMRIFDLSPNGCSFKIRVEKNDGGYPSYTNSSFRFPSEIEEIGDDEEKIDEIYSKAHDLTSFYTVKSYKELKDALDYHFYEKIDDSSSDSQPKKEQKNVPSTKLEKSETKSESKKKKEKVEEEDESNDSSLIDDDEINDMLEGLDD
jgi:hypothetical protein